MKTPLTAMAAVALTFASANADVISRVSLSGKITTASEPVVRQSGSFINSTSKLNASGITNAAILDVMAVEGAIPEKKGYTVIEMSGDDGISSGYYVYNAKTGSTVQVDPLLLTSLSGNRQATAVTSKVRTSTPEVFESRTTRSAGTATASIFGVEASVFYTGASTLKHHKVRVSGEIVDTPYVSGNYTASIRGVSDDDEVIDARLVANNGSYIESAE